MSMAEPLKELRERAREWLSKLLRRNRQPQRFETVDLILPSICEHWKEDGVFVVIQLTDLHIEARIGGRDIRWSRETGRVTDTGFFVDPQQAESV